MTVNELSERLSMKEYQEWIAFFEVKAKLEKDAMDKAMKKIKYKRTTWPLV